MHTHITKTLGQSDDIEVFRQVDRYESPVQILIEINTWTADQTMEITMTNEQARYLAEEILKQLAYGKPEIEGQLAVL